MALAQPIKRPSRLRDVAPGVALVVALAFIGGCEVGSYFDPSEMGRFEHKPLVVPILKNLDTGIEETDERFVNASDVRPADLVTVSKDYVIGKNDLIQISITDLVAPGVESQKVTRVSESGMITLPLIKQVQAAGLTEAQLEEAIVQAYRDANLIQNAQVSVVTVEARSRTFSIYGAVTQTGQYAIVDSDFRLINALVLARDTTSAIGIDYIYVIRQKEFDITEEEAGTAPTAPATQPAPDIFTPGAAAPAPKMMLQTPADAPTTAPATGAESRIIIVDDKPMQIEGGQPVVVPPAVAPETTGQAPDAKGFEFNPLSEPTGVRVIRVPFEPLKRGELKYNIVIRPQDFIWVPQPQIGEYYMGGHVQRTGVYSLSARTITLMQAVIAAGGLDQLAIPQRTMIVRRLAPDKQVFARVDLAKIFAGEEPDIVLKADDQVLVGTNFFAPFLASFRQGFRLTYGFGFIYDRNYYDDPNQ